MKQISFFCTKMQKLFVLLTLIVIFPDNSNAQIGLGGFDAVLTIPTARILNDGEYSFGFGFIPKKFTEFQSRKKKYDNLPYFFTIGFLPRVEISLRATKALGRAEGSMGDRMASLRLLLLKESKHFPAILVGMHDVSAIMRNREWFHAFYLATTKKLILNEFLHFEANAGYGFDFISAKNHEFVGVFGGGTVSLFEILLAKAEYDGNTFNAGLGLELFNFVSTNFLLYELREFAFGLNFHHNF